MVDYPYSGKTLAWLIENYASHAQDANYRRAIAIKIGSLFTASETPPIIKGNMAILDNSIIRNVPGGDIEKTDDGWLVAQDITNIWLFRSGGEVAEQKDIIWRRYGNHVLSLYSVTDAKELFYVDENGNIVQLEGHYGVGQDILLFCDETGIEIANPGISYVAALTRHNPYVNFSKLKVRKARIIVSAIGNEAGNGKGIEVITGGELVAKVEWNGNSEQKNLRGDWNDINFDAVGDQKLEIKVKGSSVTEDLTVYSVRLQFDSYGGEI